MRRVDALIRERLASDVALIRQVGEHIVASGGKRLRPALHLLTASAAGFRGDARFELAAVIGKTAKNVPVRMPSWSALANTAS